MKKFLPAIFGACSLIVPALADAQARFPLPADIQDSNIFHAFNWTLRDIEAEIPRIAAAGFGAVQTSPLQRKGSVGDHWADLYRPFDLDFVEYCALGNEEDLKALCETAAQYGVKVVVDVVANHMEDDATKRDKWWRSTSSSANLARLRNLGAINYNDRNSMITHNLVGNNDVITEREDVQERAVQYVQKLADLGVKGIRWDGAKHIGLPSEGDNFWPAVTSAVPGMWHYGETLGNPGTNSDSRWNVMREYTQYMSVVDENFGNEARSAASVGGILGKTAFLSQTKAENSSALELPARKMVLWGESHDTYSNSGGSTKYASQETIDRAYIFAACHPDETALYFSRPSESNYNFIKVGAKGSVHALEDPAIRAVNEFRNLNVGKAQAWDLSKAAAGSSTGAQACYTRKGGGALVLALPGRETTVTLSNAGGYVTPGEYDDLVSGNKFTVTSSTISGKVGTTGVAHLEPNTAGVEDIAADILDGEGRPVYYNVNGIRVQNPTSGIYIVKTSKGVKKVIL